MIDLKKYIASIVAESDHQLSWAEPEHWVRSELFQRLKVDEIQSGLEPLAMEVPYYTRVRSTGKENDAGPPYGKWIDLLLVDKEHRTWQWLELKVVHLPNHKRPLDALKPFIYDTASLLGFQLDATIAGWRNPPKKMKLTKVTPFFTKATDRLHDAKHHFNSVLLLLHPGVDIGLEFSEIDFVKNIETRIHQRGWFEYQRPSANFATKIEAMGRSRCGIMGTLVTAQWSL